MMKKETEFPVLNGILTEHLEKGARIVKQEGRWHLLSVDGDFIACGDTISAMLVNLIFIDGA